MDKKQEQRLALNEALFRDVNERIREISDSFGQKDSTYDFLCECSDPEYDGAESLLAHVRRYEFVRARLPCRSGSPKCHARLPVMVSRARRRISCRYVETVESARGVGPPGQVTDEGLQGSRADDTEHEQNTQTEQKPQLRHTHSPSSFLTNEGSRVRKVCRS